MRKKKNRTQEQFAEKINVSRITVAKWKIERHVPIIKI